MHVHSTAPSPFESNTQYDGNVSSLAYRELRDLIMNALMVHVRMLEVYRFLSVYAFIFPFALLVGYSFYLQPRFISSKFSYSMKHSSEAKFKLRVLGLMIIFGSALFPFVFVFLWK